jgi:hypothetical protein
VPAATLGNASAGTVAGRPTAAANGPMPGPTAPAGAPTPPAPGRTTSATTPSDACGSGLSEPGEVFLKPCVRTDGGLAVAASTSVQNPGEVLVDNCAQVYRVNSDGGTTRVHDFGCAGWRSDAQFRWDTSWTFPGHGTFVIEAGFWATIDGSYGYNGGARSGRITIP